MLKKVSSKPLSEICSVISSGGTPSRKMSHYFDQNGHLWVKSKELLFQGIDDTEEKISDEGLKKSSAKYYPEGSVLVAMYGANVGQLAWLKKPATVNQAICALVVDKQKADNKFVYYSLLCTREKLIVQAQGAAQQNLNAGQIRSFEIPYFDLESQQKIASMLSAYDDLIENNSRRIAILEEMARNLYREWFVKFRFPGHETVKMVDSELGQIPEGWEINKVHELFNLNIGKTPPRNEAQWFSQQEGIKWISIKDIGLNRIFVLNTSEKLTDEAIKNSNVKIVPANTVIMSFKLTVGKVAITSEDMVTNEAIAHFNIKDNSVMCKEYIYFYLQNFMFQTLGNTSSIGTAINSQVVKSMPVLLPNKLLMIRFKNLVVPFFEQIFTIVKSNQNLKTQRDMLLPKLISGKIAI